MAHSRRIVDRRLLLVATFILPSLVVGAETPEAAWEFPDPVEYTSHISALCKPEVSSALFIASLRDSGQTKSQVEKSLPQGTPERLRLTHVVVENLDDLFAFPEVSSIAYYAFRGRACTAEKAEGKPPLLFASIASEALKCQREMGVQDRPKLAKCIYEVMTKAMANTSLERTRER